MKRLFLTTTLLTVLAFALSPSALGFSRNFVAPLSGPDGVETKARGVAIFHYDDAGTADPDDDVILYKLIVANIENVTMAHIHLRPNAETPNGPPVVWLYPSGPPPTLIPGRFQGTLAEGTITKANLVGLLAGMTLGDLVQKVIDGLTYVNVHTAQYPAGEIRGDLFADNRP